MGTFDFEHNKTRSLSSGSETYHLFDEMTESLMTAMYLVPKSTWQFSLLRNFAFVKGLRCLCSTSSAMTTSRQFQELCGIVSRSIGGLDDLESSLNGFKASLSSSLVTQVIDSCETEAPARRLLRFFLWSCKNLRWDLRDKDYNHAMRVFAGKKDHTALEILIADLEKDGREMEKQTYSVVANALVTLGREDEALGIFRNLDKYKCPQDSSTVVATVSALCAHGHAKRAEGVVWHHRDKISGFERCVYRSILYGWAEQENVKEARRIIKEMKSSGIMPDLFCYNTLLRGLCERNLKRNPSGLVPEALNVMMEMRSYKIAPTSISYNILLSCLGKARRVKESCQILERMKMTGCSPDWMSYYLVVRVLYLSMRFGKGNKLVDEMIGQGLVPTCKFYYDLIGVLCGVERPYYALELFERMKRSSLGGYGPVYDVLIPKLCTGGDFEKGRELWDEAVNMGVELRCSSNFLDPSITKVFKPTRKEESISLPDCTSAKDDDKNNNNNNNKSNINRKNVIFKLAKDKNKTKNITSNKKNVRKPYKKKINTKKKKNTGAV